MADRSARLAFILSLTDKVSAPLGKVKTSFTDLATQGQQNIMKMGTGLAGMWVRVWPSRNRWNLRWR